MVFQRDGLHGYLWCGQDRAVVQAGARVVGHGEGLVRLETEGLHVRVVNVMHEPLAPQLWRVIPPEPLKAVPEDAGRAGRPPGVRGRGPVEGRAKEIVEAAHVIHVQVRQQQVVGGLHLRERQRVQHVRAAVQQQARLPLPAVRHDPQRVVFRRSAQHPCPQHAA